MIFKKQDNLNQTEFAEVAPVETAVDPAEIDPEVATLVAKKKKRTKKILLFVGGSLLVVSLILFGFSLIPKKGPTKKKAVPTPTPTPPVIDQSLLGRLESFKTELKTYDPAEENLYFPKVSEQIYLDAPRPN